MRDHPLRPAAPQLARRNHLFTLSCIGNRGGGKHGSLGGALEKIYYKMFRILHLRRLIQERRADSSSEWAKQEEARVFLFSGFDKLRKGMVTSQRQRTCRKKKRDYLSRLGLLC